MGKSAPPLPPTHPPNTQQHKTKTQIFHMEITQKSIVSHDGKLNQQEVIYLAYAATFAPLTHAACKTVTLYCETLSHFHTINAIAFTTDFAIPQQRALTVIF